MYTRTRSPTSISSLAAIAVSTLIACEKETTPPSGSGEAPPAAGSAPAPQTEHAAKPAVVVTPPEVPGVSPPSGDASASFSVVGVAEGDVLNMRSAPDAASAIVGSIPPNTSGIASIGAPTQVEQTTWQRVSYGGNVGWVNSRFLSSATSASPAQLAALEHLICFGNEPFWAVQFKTDGSATCDAMCEGPPGLRVVNVSMTTQGEPQGFDLLDAKGGLFLRGALRKTGKCSDGMSDNVHPYVFSSTGKPGPFEGCCRDRRVKLPYG
jgi:uncharacterized membrane protein